MLCLPLLLRLREAAATLLLNPVVVRFKALKSTVKMPLASRLL
jgi:hypothetical protein